MEDRRELFISASLNDGLIGRVIDRAIDAGYRIHVFFLAPEGSEISGAGACGEEQAVAASPVKERVSAPVKAPGRQRRSAGESLAALEKCWKEGMNVMELCEASGVSTSTYNRIKGKLPEAVIDGLKGRRRAVCKKGSDIIPMVYSADEKALRNRQKEAERNRVHGYSNDKSLIF